MSSSHLRPGDRVYATSVPVGIPLFENRAHSYEPESDPEEVSRSIVKCTAQKTKFSIEDLFSKFNQIGRKLRIWSYLLKKSLIGNFIFCVAIGIIDTTMIYCESFISQVFIPKLILVKYNSIKSSYYRKKPPQISVTSFTGFVENSCFENLCFFKPLKKVNVSEKRAFRVNL